MSGAGLGMLAVGLAPPSMFWLALTGVLFAGFMNPITNGPIFAVLQAAVAPEMQGRVFTLMMSTGSAMSPLGLVVAVPVADALNVPIWYVFAGAASILAGVAAPFIPDIRYLEDRGPTTARTVPSSAALSPLISPPTWRDQAPASPHARKGDTVSAAVRQQPPARAMPYPMRSAIGYAKWCIVTRRPFV